MKLKLSDGSIIENISYAAPNTIDGKLTIGINGSDSFAIIYSLLSNDEVLTSIQYLTDNEEEIYVFNGYTILSIFSVNKDADNMIFWLRKE